METIKLLDLCCKAGGASMGYEQAAQDLGINIEITGVDLDPQPNYPHNFIQGEAMEYLLKHGHKYTHIHISPPCQAYSCSTAMFRNKGKKYREIEIEALRAALENLKIPCVIENVPQSPLIPDVVLFGYMFGLKVIRKRHFECVNWWMMCPQPDKRMGTVADGDFVSVYGKAKWKNTNDSNKRKQQKIPTWRKKTIRETWAYAMGMPHHMTDTELAESIPPAYTRYIGNEFFKSGK